VGLLGLAHAIERQIQAGAFKDYSDVARHHGLTRARVTQLLDLTLLAPDLQEQILLAEAVDGLEPMSERQLRRRVLARS
jgi:Arc/MetJ-type ribon-helix-helix transcriptional regulator